MGAIDRRTLLKGIGTAGAAGLAGIAGCAGSGGGDGTITLGLVLPFTGDFGFYGEGLERGIELAVREANESDEVLPDTEIETVSGESESNPEVAVSAARELVLQEEIDFLIGAVNTATANALRGFVDREDIAYIPAGSASDFITQGPDCNAKTFRPFNHNGLFGTAGAAWATRELGTDVYLMHGDYAYGEVVNRNIRRGVESEGGTVINREALPLGGTEYGGVIADINERDPDWVSMYMSGSGGIAFFNQAAERGLEATCAGGPPPGFALQALDQETLESLPPVYSGARLWDRSLDIGINQQFIKSFEDEYDRPPGNADEQGYLPGLCAVRMLDEAGGSDANLDDIISAGEGLTFQTSRGETTVRACDHQGAQPTFPSRVTSVEGEVAEYEVQTQTNAPEFRRDCSEIECSL
jgi:branched-chain amino acid transport system substrate-binding protein